MARTQSKPLTPYEIHRNHDVEVIITQNGPHRVQIWCKPCNCHVQWLSWSDYCQLSKSYQHNQ